MNNQVSFLTSQWLLSELWPIRTHPDEEVAAGVAKQQASWEAYLDALLDLTSGKSERHDDAGKGKPN